MYLGAKQGPSVTVLGEVIHPLPDMEVLGTWFSSRLDFSNHNTKLNDDLRARAGMIARLRHHIPKGDFLRQLAFGIFMGKLNANLAVTSRPRFLDSDPTETLMEKFQVAMNTVARALTNHKRLDGTKIPKLLEDAKLMSVNRMACRTIALEAWKATVGVDGNALAEHPVGQVLDDIIAGRTRQAGQYRLPPPSKSAHFLRNARRCLNMAPDLREATTLAQAEKAATLFAMSCPL
jgi:hypothetical protein